MQLKHSYLYLILLVLFCVGCYPKNPNLGRSNTTYIPEFITRDELEKSIKLIAPIPLRKPGKIYIYKNWVFINELYKGVHVIDNSDVRKPTKVAFIVIPGNVDIAIRNNIIYADNAVDMVSIAYTDTGIKVLSRLRETFQEPLPPDFGLIPEKFNRSNRPKNSYIISWKVH